MDWSQVLTIIIAQGAMFLWARRESRADYRRCEDLISAIHNEIKDFHGRLCAIEEKRK